MFTYGLQMFTPCDKYHFYSGFCQPATIVTAYPTGPKYRYAHIGLLKDKDILMFFAALYRKHAFINITSLP
jgi:hypothetical protein